MPRAQQKTRRPHTGANPRQAHLASNQTRSTGPSPLPFCGSDRPLHRADRREAAARVSMPVTAHSRDRQASLPAATWLNRPCERSRACPTSSR
jgi:hypothetical protein